MAKNTTASLRKALEEGKVIVIAMGVQAGEPVEYNPRNNRDRNPWCLPGTDIRYGAGELEAREATPRENASRTRKAKREASKAAQEQPAEEAPAETPQEASPAPVEAPMPSKGGKPKLAQLLDAAGIAYQMNHEEFPMSGVTVIRYMIDGKELSPAEVIAKHLA